MCEFCHHGIKMKALKPIAPKSNTKERNISPAAKLSKSLFLIQPTQEKEEENKHFLQLKNLEHSKS